MRQVLTTRLTYRGLQQTLFASLFAFVSPNDGDARLRPSRSYDWSDGFGVTAGADGMLGDAHTSFGQLSGRVHRVSEGPLQLLRRWPPRPARCEVPAREWRAEPS